MKHIKSSLAFYIAYAVGVTNIIILENVSFFHAVIIGFANVLLAKFVVDRYLTKHEAE